jgi:predicted transcriptional regulator
MRKMSDRNRSRFEIIAEILKELRTPSGKTNIMSQCNMSFAQSGHYLNLMTSNDLVRIDALEGKITYHKTETGQEFLEIFNKMALLLDSSISTPWWRLANHGTPA